MNIGTLTFQYNYNYGAVLQCLALQRAVKSMGVETSVLDFYPPVVQKPWWRGWGVTDGKFWEKAPRRGITLRHGPAMRKKFDAFRKNELEMSARCVEADVAKVANEYDAVVVGSDQIWNHAKSPAYFLEWEPAYSGRRISYAACFGQPTQPSDKIESYGKWLKRFDALSVRDEVSRDVVHNLSGRDADIVADPTLLVDLEDVAEDPGVPYKDYILTYVLGSEIEGGLKPLMNLLKSKLGDIPVVAVVPSVMTPNFSGWADQKLWNASPGQWISLVKNARFVCTDSFHCALFSMKYHRHFMAYYSVEERSHRLIDIAKRYGVSKHIVSRIADVENNELWNQPPDYTQVDQRIASHVQESLQYLHTSLKMIKKTNL